MSPEPTPPPQPEPAPPTPTPAAMTFSEAIANATRLLRAAESITDLAVMERYEKLADSWLNLANLINVRDAQT